MSNTKWEQSESDFVNLLSDCFDVGGKLVTELKEQYKDIDVIDRRKNTYSVKVQYSVDKYKTLLFEHTLKNTRNGSTKAGSIEYCEADYVAVSFKSNSNQWWFIMPTKDLKTYIDAGEWRQ